MPIGGIWRKQESNVDSFTEVVKGADGIFVATDFYSCQLFDQLPCRDPDRTDQGERCARNVIDAYAS